MNGIQTSSLMPTLGVIVQNINLQNTISSVTIQLLKKLLIENKLVIIRNQGSISEERQVEVSSWFGELEIAGFEPHIKSSSPYILRVSNEASEGLQNFGTTGFHIDCSFLEVPNSISVYHIVNNPSEGDTVFIPFNDLVNNLTTETRQRWERLHMVKTYKYVKRYTEKPGYVIHPLVYQHPVSQESAMVIHQGHTSCFIWDKGTPSERKTHKDETAQIMSEIDNEFKKYEDSLWYRHKWKSGDILISDNLALAHWATPQTQRPAKEVGLRVMHRTIVKGTHRPQKLG